MCSCCWARETRSAFLERGRAATTLRRVRPLPDGPRVGDPATAELDFGSRKPHNYSSGLPAALAGAAVSVGAAALLPVRSPSTAENDEYAPSGQRLRVLDPCCGSGTVVFEAWRRGFEACGGDAEASMVDMSRQNLAHFAPLLLQHPPPVVQVRPRVLQHGSSTESI
jgi:SAM-dependent methyltransferase